MGKNEKKHNNIQVIHLFTLETSAPVNSSGPMPPSLWLLGIIPLVVVIANWRLTLTGRIRGLN